MEKDLNKIPAFSQKLHGNIYDIFTLTNRVGVFHVTSVGGYMDDFKEGSIKNEKEPAFFEYFKDFNKEELKSIWYVNHGLEKGDFDFYDPEALVNSVEKRKGITKNDEEYKIISALYRIFLEGIQAAYHGKEEDFKKDYAIKGPFKQRSEIYKNGELWKIAIFILDNGEEAKKAKEENGNKYSVIGTWNPEEDGIAVYFGDKGRFGHFCASCLSLNLKELDSSDDTNLDYIHTSKVIFEEDAKRYIEKVIKNDKTLESRQSYVISDYDYPRTRQRTPDYRIYEPARYTSNPHRGKKEIQIQPLNRLSRSERKKLKNKK